MAAYQHRVTGFFVKFEEAAIARVELVKRGIPLEQIALFANDHPASDGSTTPQSSNTLKDMVVDGAIGTAVGGALGALGELALVASNVTLFVASPLLAPLTMLGWGASLGAVVGAATGAVHLSKADGTLSDLVRDAIQQGQVVLVVTTYSEPQTQTAIEVIRLAVGEYTDEARPRA